MDNLPDKLIRDNVPALMADEGTVAITRTLDDREFARALRTRLQDSARAYIARPGLQSMAEIAEALDALRAAMGFTAAELEAERARLLEREGGFERRLLLETVSRAQPDDAPPAPSTPAPVGEAAAGPQTAA